MNTTSALPRSTLIPLWLALSLYVLVLPTAGTIALRNLGFVGLFVIFIYISLRYRIRPELPFALPWLAYAFVAFVSLFYAVDPAYSGRDFVAEFAYSTFILCFAATMSRRISLLDGLIALFVALNASSLISLLARYPFSEISSTADPYRTNIDAFSRVALNPNYLIAIMPMVGLGAWRLWQSGRRTPAMALLALLSADTGALLLSGNRQSLVALAAALICMLPFLPRRALKRYAIAMVALALVVVGLFVLQLWRRQWTGGGILVDVAHDPRWTLWRFAIEKIYEHPWQGGGFGRAVFSKLYPDFVRENPMLWHAHDMFLNRGIQMGIPGMAAFIWLWAAALNRLACYARSPHTAIAAIGLAGWSIACGVLFKNLTDDFFLRDPALLFWLQIGVIVGEIRREEETSM